MASLWRTLFVLGGGGGFAGYKTGFFEKWSEFDFFDWKNQHKNNDSQSNYNNNGQYSTSPQVIVYEPNNNLDNNSSRWLAISSSTALLALAGYYYYIHKSGTTKVINKVEETAEQTQDLVTESDKKNAIRFNELDTRNTQRSQNLETEIKSETRAGFQIVSDQLSGVTEVCVKILQAIAPRNENTEHFTDGALTACENREERFEQYKAQNLQDIRAEIHSKNPQLSSMQQVQYNMEYTTPGGPNDSGMTPMGPSNDNNFNIFDCDANQTPYLTNMSYKDSEAMKNQNKNSEDKSEQNSNDSGIFMNGFKKVLNVLPGSEKINKMIEIYEMKNEIYEKYDQNKYMIFSGVCAAGAMYSSYKYMFPTNRNHCNYHNGAMITYNSHPNGNYTHQ